MLIVLIVSALALVIAVSSVVFRPRLAAGLREKPLLSESALLSEVAELAARSRNYAKRGDGLSVRLIERTCSAAMSLIRGKVRGGAELSDCEREFYNGYAKIVEAIGDVKPRLGQTKNLPHFDGAPRAYLFAELVLKSCGGAAKREIVELAADAFCDVKPFTIDEANELDTLFKFAALDECAAVAVSLVHRDERESAAERDGERERVDVDTLWSPTYVKTLSERADSKFYGELSRLCRDNGFSVDSREREYYAVEEKTRSRLRGALATLDGFSRELPAERLRLTSGAARELSGADGFENLTDDTIGYYLNRVKILARKNGTDEGCFAARIAERARRENVDVGELLLPKRLSVVAYVAIFLLKASVTAAVLFAVSAAFAVTALVVALAALPTYFGVGALIDYYISLALPERRLPCVKFDKTDENATANLVCARLITSIGEAKDAVKRLEATACANRSKRFSYTLLVDFPRAATKRERADEAILTVLSREFERLGGRFNLLVRHRSRMKEANAWQGWERKRGALLDLNGLILRGDRTPFRVITGDSYRAKYVIALDADTRLDCAERLVGTFEHPCSRRYAVLGVNSFAAPRSINNFFTRIAAGALGISGYDEGRAYGVEWNGFGSGNFTGKGIYDVERFDGAVRREFPDGRILSHDYIEGAIAGCGESGAGTIDDFPATYSKFLERNLRWLRGDLQLLPRIFGKVKNAEGKRVKNRLGAVSRGRILSNAARSLVPPLCLALVGVRAVGGLVACGVLAAFPYAVEGLLALGASGAKAKTRGVLRAAGRFLLVPATAILNSAAIFKTAVALARGKGLLEWRTFAHSKGVEYGLPQLCAALVLSALSFVFTKRFGVPILCAAYALAVPIVAFCDEKRSKTPKLSDRDRAFLNLAAERTWRYFADALTEKTNFLPPDNYDERAGKGYAYRTSPTDIGMALTATYCAAKLGIIKPEKARELIRRAVDSIEKLPKTDEGCLYNWYDVRTLSALNPRYVSSADEGNFLCSLALAGRIADEDVRGKINALISRTSFEKLYDGERGMLRIGYDETSKRYDGHYDLLASESAITYLVGIGYGLLPRSCWSAPSRRTVRAYGKIALQSWTGGAFEYLMPPLFFEYGRGTLLGESATAAAHAQRRYGGRREYFGASEGLYDAREDNGDYRYRACGVPVLALSESAESSAFSPYACALTLPYLGSAACEALEGFETAGAFGNYGFCDAVDGEPLRCRMSHHQGMLLAAITNVLRDNAIVCELGELAEFASCETLLAERECEAKPRKSARKRDERVEKRREVAFEGEYLERSYFVYSRGDYFLAAAEDGSGTARLGETDLYRERGFKITASAGAVECDLTRGGKTVFCESEARYEFSKSLFCGSVVARVFNEIVGEARRVKIRNKSDCALVVTVCASVEPIAGRVEDDRAHREFYAMKLDCFKRDGCAVARRDETATCVALGASEDGEVIVDRRYFYGRRAKKRELITDGILAVKVAVKLAAGEEKNVDFFFVAAHDENKLFSAIETARGRGFFDRDGVGGRSDPLASKIFTAAKNVVGCYRTGRNGAFDDRVSTGEIGLDISRPTLVVRSDGAAYSKRLRRKLNAATEAARAGARLNLVVVYREKRGYRAEESERIKIELDGSGARSTFGGFIKVINEIGRESLVKAVTECSIEPKFAREKIGEKLSLVTPAEPAPNYVEPEIALRSARGGFTADGEFFIPLDKPLAKPWSNVIADSVTTESGGGFTFLGNAREKRITEYSGDSVLDFPSERIVLCEGEIEWSATKNGAKTLKTHSGGYSEVMGEKGVNSTENRFAKYYAIHGKGYTKYVCAGFGAITTATEFAARTGQKIFLVEMENATERRRTITVKIELDLVLGDLIERTRSSLEVYRDGDVERGRCALSGMEVELRGEAIDCEGTADESARSRGRTLRKAIRLVVPPRGEAKAAFALSAAGGETVDLKNAERLLDERKRFYSSLSPVEIISPKDATSELHAFLPYQTACARFTARTGFYQTGGAIGFRDQLQDAAAMATTLPDVVREHILKCASKQFKEGDVLHWWHEPSLGVRTKIVDDRLFLPLAAATYIKVTRDEEILRERAFYLKGDELPRGVKSAYKFYERSNEDDSLLAHCVLAIESVELDESGLAYLGGGDWLDGVDEAGLRGKGTSVFTTMLAFKAITELLPFVHERTARESLMARRERLRKGISSAWRGDRYARFVTDDGVEYGVESAPADKVDLLVAAFAGLCGACESDRVKRAQDTALARLVDEKNGIIKLLDPPFGKTSGIGYITRYPAGVRENGGQYTHAAAWFIISLLKCGRIADAERLLAMINPINRSADAESAERYEAEPYAVCGDVYSSGEGGWSWYTGAAGWLYRAITEFYLGVTFSGDSVSFDPHVGEGKRFEVAIRRGGARFIAEIDGGNAGGAVALEIGGVKYNGDTIKATAKLDGKRIRVTREKT